MGPCFRRDDGRGCDYQTATSSLRATGSARMRGLHILVISSSFLRKQEPIRRAVSVGCAVRNLPSNERRWLWVPAFAGTTEEDSIVKQPTRNDVDGDSDTTSSSRRCAPEALLQFPPKEGVGNAGCPMHPRSRVRCVVAGSTRAATSTPESPGIPARNGFNGLLRALPGDRALLPPSFAD